MAMVVLKKGLYCFLWERATLSRGEGRAVEDWERYQAGSIQSGRGFLGLVCFFSGCESGHHDFGLCLGDNLVIGAMLAIAADNVTLPFPIEKEIGVRLLEALSGQGRNKGDAVDRGGGSYPGQFGESGHEIPEGEISPDNK